MVRVRLGFGLGLGRVEAHKANALLARRALYGLVVRARQRRRLEGGRGARGHQAPWRDLKGREQPHRGSTARAQRAGEARQHLGLGIGLGLGLGLG